jgi:hypothetical protein
LTESWVTCSEANTSSIRCATKPVLIHISRSAVAWPTSRGFHLHASVSPHRKHDLRHTGRSPSPEAGTGAFRPGEAATLNARRFARGRRPYAATGSAGAPKGPGLVRSCGNSRIPARSRRHRVVP